jgi:aminopeptidase YwaD
MRCAPLSLRLRNNSFALLTVLALAVSACAARPASPTAHPFATPDQAAFSGQRAMETVQWLSETVGVRAAGSPNDRRAAEEMAARLREWGYDVQLQTFPVLRFQDNGATLKIEGTRAMSMSVLSIGNSISGKVRARVVDVGYGRTQDYSGHDVRGAVALIQRGEIFFSEKIANASGAGAAGVIVYNNTPGIIRGMTRTKSSIPAVALSSEDGRSLADLLRSQAITAELSADTSITDGTSQNVVATLRGAEEQAVVLGAHIDSVPDGPGANDDASGVATVMELARALASAAPPNRPSYTLRVVLFGAEEIGLIGSEYYMRSLARSDYDNMVAMLDFDMVGVGDQLHAGGTESLDKLAFDIAASQGVSLMPLPSNAVGASDYAVFLDATPALLFYRSEDQRYHTAKDQAEFLDQNNLRLMGRLALQLLGELKNLK